MVEQVYWKQKYRESAFREVICRPSSWLLSPIFSNLDRIIWNVLNNCFRSYKFGGTHQWHKEAMLFQTWNDELKAEWWNFKAVNAKSSI